MKSMSSVSKAVVQPPSNPAEIDILYSEILGHLKQTDFSAYETATRAFSWLLCMREPLSSVAFIDAVFNETPGRHGLNLAELLSICSNLIVYDKQLDTLRFAHASFKEFLEQEAEFNKRSIHMVATLSCIEACIKRLPITIEDEIHPDKDYNFYAVMYWAEHCSLAISSGDDELNKKLEEFIVGDDGFMFQLWLEAASEVSILLPRSHSLKPKLKEVLSVSETPFFTACVFGLKKVFDLSVETLDFDVNTTNFMGQTGLYLAAAFGHNHLMNRFLVLGADPDIARGRYRDPLSAASAGGHASVVEFLLNQKAYSSSMNIEEALRVSFLTGHEETSKILIKSYLNQAGGGKSDPPNDNSWLLEAASQVGFTEVMSELAKGPQTGSLSPANSLKFVQSAVRKGRIDIIRKMIENASLPTDVIAIAALFGKIEIINLCSNKGYSVEERSHFGTPLRCASLMGHENTARALVSFGAKVNAITKFGDALQAAAMKGHISITKALIQLRANVNNRGGFFGNALQAAAYRGHRDVVEILLDAGAFIDRRGRYRDAFHAASEAGQAIIVSLFIDRGYSFSQLELQDLGLPDGRGRFECLPSTRNLALTSVLGPAWEVQTPAIDEPQVAYTPNYPLAKYYALEAAASRGHLTVVERLLASRKRLNIQKPHFGYALWEASKHGYTEIVKCLTAVEVDLRSFSLGSIERAARNGHMETIDVLIQNEEKWGPDMVEPEYASWPKLDPKDPKDARQHMVSLLPIVYIKMALAFFFLKNAQLDEFCKSRYALMLAIAKCRKDKLSTVMRSFQSADQLAIKELRVLALVESAQSDRIDILKLLLCSFLKFTPRAMADAI